MKQRYWFMKKDYEWYPHHIENIETIKQNPDYFVMRFTLKEKLKRKFGFGKVNRFECWVKDRTGKQYKCFIDLRRTKEYPNGKCKFLGIIK